MWPVRSAKGYSSSNDRWTSVSERRLNSVKAAPVDSDANEDGIYVIHAVADSTVKRSPAPREKVEASRPSYIRLDIQGLRAVAVGAVIIYHATPYLPGGFIGVDVFFVISGYVIAGVLSRSIDSSPNRSASFSPDVSGGLCRRQRQWWRPRWF